MVVIFVNNSVRSTSHPRFFAGLPTAAHFRLKYNNVGVHDDKPANSRWRESDLLSFSSTVPTRSSFVPIVENHSSINSDNRNYPKNCVCSVYKKKKIATIGPAVPEIIGTGDSRFHVYTHAYSMHNAVLIRLSSVVFFSYFFLLILSYLDEHFWHWSGSNTFTEDVYKYFDRSMGNESRAWLSVN